MSFESIKNLSSQKQFDEGLLETSWQVSHVFSFEQVLHWD